MDQKGLWAAEIHFGAGAGGIVHPLGDNIYVGGALGRYFGTTKDGRSIEKGALLSYDHTTKSLDPLERSSEDGNYYGWTASPIGFSISISRGTVENFDDRSEIYGVNVFGIGVSVSTSGILTFDVATRGVGLGLFHLYSDSKRIPTISYPKSTDQDKAN